MPKRKAVVALGSNSGDRLSNLTEGLARLAEEGDVRVVAVSGVYETEAQGKATGQNFYNAAALVETALDPVELIALLGRIERTFGRDEDRRREDGGRRLDLDLIYLGDVVYDRDGIVVPHPRRRWRDFVLAPASEIAPRFVDPEDGLTVSELWENLKKTGAPPPERVAEIKRLL
ncbi:MAG: 2-amino-4-hydroxy-6-hydroxymethyldihydropteridine diphosphokinase [Candidatus Coatesbacteria bacterium RBG_13_66_14]|uniref:2-amino-4-hydroxy-6-hydroxymethyldihydropteridine diphosphokinase n=1 Tax=Candidatus Coatesbacteria bacterium RBG_13_66_14 TaxID=1817816 RepID=A0A1F5FB55_9BACT|nr:MAG: 2-amino-4-hydroxy-6-hydroxymethyldihydropteridine diphosphokinase [Candidatus Coatesbacteria bacterium RBG_13_66_14]